MSWEPTFCLRGMLMDWQHVNFVLHVGFLPSQEKKTAVSKLENLQDSAKELLKPPTSLRVGSAGSGGSARCGCS